jgi:hypothetical protein
MKVLSPPPSSTFRALVSGVLTAVSAIPLGIWVNAVSSNLPSSTDIWAAAAKTGTADLTGPVGLSILAINILLLYRWDVLESKWRNVVEYTRARQTLSMQKQTLKSYCNFVSEILGIPVSARAFEARNEKTSTGQKETRLYQVRDLFVENEPFAQESAYTYVRIDDKNFVASRAFATRSPKFEVLPADHYKMYGERERNMVEPAQRWVLAAPILRFDVAGSPRDELMPRGVIVFYGKEVPKVAEGTREWELVKSLSRDAAEFFANLPLSGLDRDQAEQRAK